jgi:serine/threonine protein kinase/tetratricopeptide (TPR) repeat protein
VDKRILTTSALFNNRYTIIDEIGKGGMGTVYRATDRLSGHDIALKRMLFSPDQLMFKTRSETADPRVALAREFQVLASLHHPNVIEVLDYGFDEFDQPFFSMRLLEDARDIVSVGRERNIDGKIDLLIKLLQALAYLHRRGLMHRDLKPANVLVEGGEVVQVLDFGLAIEDAENTEIAGTLAYIAPEVLRHKVPTFTADLYAVGIIAYEMLAGKHPFNISTMRTLMHDVLQSEPDIGALLQGIESSQSVIAETNDVESDAVESEAVDHETNVVHVLNAALGITMPIVPEALDTSNPATLQSSGEKLPSSGRVDTSVALAGLVINLLSKDPSQRLQTADDVIDRLCKAIGQPPPSESAAIRESFLQSAKFIGRETELDQLKNALTEAINGRGGGWLCGGESGVGKSRLLGELRTYALVNGVQVLNGHGVAEGGLGYQFWREAMRRLVISTPPDDTDASILKPIVPDIETLLERSIPDAPELPPTESQRRLIGTISSMFSRQTQPSLLVLEDLHWGTESIAVLKSLSILVKGWSMLIVGSFRDDEMPELPDQLRNMELLKVERLNPQQIADLSASILGDGGRDPEVLELLQRETEGNMFFLVEVVRVLAIDAGSLSEVSMMTLPRSVFAGGIQKVVERRLANLSTSAIRPLELAAIGGRFIDLGVLQAAIHASIEHEADFELDRWLSECANGAVLERPAEQWRFVHDKIREGVLSRISEANHRRLNRVVAEAFETVYADGETRRQHAINLVHLWHEANDLKKEAHYAALAGDIQRAATAVRDAIRYYTRALELLAMPEVEAQPETITFVTLKLGETYNILGNFEPSHEHLKEAVERARAEDNEPLLARGLQRLAHTVFVLALDEDPKAYANESRELFQRLNDPAGEVTALRVLGTIANRKGEYAVARPYFEHGLEILPKNHYLEPELIGDLEVIAEAEGDYALAEKLSHQALDMFQALGDKIGVADCYMKLGIIHGKQNLTAESKAYYEKTLAINRELALVNNVAITLLNLGISNKNLGDYESSLACYMESSSIFEQSGMRMGVGVNHINTARVLELMGRLREARQHLADAVKVAVEIEIPPLYPHILIAYARLEHVDGRLERAFEIVSMVKEKMGGDKSLEDEAQTLLDEWAVDLSAEAIDAAAERGKTLERDDLFEEIKQVNIEADSSSEAS